MTTVAYPAYLNLSATQLAERVERALASLEVCRACPRDCQVNRLEDKWSACKTGRYAVVSSHFPHFGEEDCLRGWQGSGTIFFGHCNLRCVFCQNYDISQALPPGHQSAMPRSGTGGPQLLAGSRPESIAGMMLELQALGCHNINLVTPEHVVPQVLESLLPAIRGGLRVPIVYNTSAYDSLESIQLMDGIVDIYMPDFKYSSHASSKTYLKAGNYPEAARVAVKEMHRQVGDLVIDDHGLARRGLLIRHLAMPGGIDETRAILEWIACELGSGSYVNVMDQYRPAGKVSGEKYGEINRRLTSVEFAVAEGIARDLGLRLDARGVRPPV